MNIAIDALLKQLPARPIIEAWSAALFPSSKSDLNIIKIVTVKRLVIAGTIKMERQMHRKLHTA